MLALFEKSGNEKLMKQVLTSLFDAVSESREIRHYFLNVRLERLIKDQMLYSPYILHRPDRYDAGDVSQTATTDIQIRMRLFDEIVFNLRRILKEANFPEDDIPRLSADMMEIIEETRCQANDTVIAVWKPLDLVGEALANYLRRQRVDTRLEPNGDLYAFTGVTYPFWIRQNPEKLTITIFIQAYAKERVTLETVQAIADKANKTPKSFTVQAREGTSVPIFGAQLVFPYQLGVPIRLFMRSIRQVGIDFEKALLQDTDQRLRNVVK